MAGSEVRVLQPSGAITATGAGAGSQTPADGETVAVQIAVSAASGTTPSVTFEVQWSVDGVNWHSADGTADTFAAITAAKNVCKNFTVKGTYMRLVWTVTGTTPSFTVLATASGISLPG